MKQAYIFLIDDFEEIEALTTVDILRRGNVEVKTISLMKRLEVTGLHQITVKADLLFEEADLSFAQMLILPGGTPKIAEHLALKEAVVDFAKKGGRISAICAAPMLLGQTGLLVGKRATAYPGFEQYLEGAQVSTEDVVIDGNIVTARGPGLSIPFALTLLRILTDEHTAKQVATGLLYHI